MPGAPVERFFLEQLELIGGWESIWERTANAESQEDIAASFGVSQGWLSRVIHKDPERSAAYREAKRAAAQIYADEAKRILDDCPVERDHIALARERSGVRRWLATVHDRAQFGEPRPGLEVTVNVGQLHLDALRHRSVNAETVVLVKDAQRLLLRSGAATDERNREPQPPGSLASLSDHPDDAYHGAHGSVADVTQVNADAGGESSVT